MSIGPSNPHPVCAPIVDANAKPSAFGLYKSPSEAVKEVQESYKKWTGQLTQRSFELSMAVIAANWATFGSINPLLSNIWAKFSIGIVVLGLVINILATWLMARWLQQRIDYAESDLARWSDEFGRLQSRKDPWPFTKDIENTAEGLRLGKTFIPLIGGICYVAALLFA